MISAKQQLRALDSELLTAIRSQFVYEQGMLDIRFSVKIPVEDNSIDLAWHGSGATRQEQQIYRSDRRLNTQPRRTMLSFGLCGAFLQAGLSRNRVNVSKALDQIAALIREGCCQCCEK